MAKRARTERREAERDAAKLARARIKLAALEAGGSPDLPIEVTSASIIEPHAQSMYCAACGNHGLRIDEHLAQTFPGERRLRVLKSRCPQCGTQRDLFFRIGTTLAS